MEKRPITVEELFGFALRNNGREFRTLARNSPFTLQGMSDRIRLLLPSNTYFTVKRDFAKWYVDYYNKVSLADADLTTPYPAQWRERSYMVRILQATRLELERKEAPTTKEPAVIKSSVLQPRRRDWTEGELLVALNLYHKLTFGQMHGRHPAIVAVAEKLGRTPDALAMKLCNFASLDPALKMRGIKGLSGASKRDELAWTEFHNNLSEAAPASEEAFQKLFSVEADEEIEVTPNTGLLLRKIPSGPTDTWSTTKQRRGQNYFRNAVLNNYGARCGVTGFGVRELLIASHILPWGRYEAERLNVRNGIALSRLHDAAFDVGLITFDSEMRLRLSKELKSHLPQRMVVECFGAYEGESLQLPKDAALPDEKFLALHRVKAPMKWK